MRQGNTSNRPAWVRAFRWAAICLAAVVLLILLLAALAIQTYTDARPAALPEPPPAGPEQAEQLRARVTAFQQAIRQQRPTDPLVLSPDEINTLIATDPAFKVLRGRFYVELSDARPAAQMSFPLRELHIPFLNGRYLNGTATFRITILNGNLTVNPEGLLIKGRYLPGIIMSKLRQQNLAEKINDDPRASLALERIQSVEVKDGKVIVTPKPNQ